MDGKRSFTVATIKSPGKKSRSRKSMEGGRFIAKTPSAAARKAVTAACRGRKAGGQCTFTVKIRETTQGGKGKNFEYRVKRVKDPVTVVHDGEEIVHNYRSIVKSLNIK